MANQGSKAIPHLEWEYVGGLSGALTSPLPPFLLLLGASKRFFKNLWLVVSINLNQKKNVNYWIIFLCVKMTHLL